MLLRAANIRNDPLANCVFPATCRIPVLVTAAQKDLWKIRNGSRKEREASAACPSERLQKLSIDLHYQRQTEEVIWSVPAWVRVSNAPRAL